MERCNYTVDGHNLINNILEDRSSKVKKTLPLSVPVPTLVQQCAFFVANSPSEIKTDNILLIEVTEWINQYRS